MEQQEEHCCWTVAGTAQTTPWQVPDLRTNNAPNNMFVSFFFKNVLACQDL
jgi:hypothetical protein